MKQFLVRSFFLISFFSIAASLRAEDPPKPKPECVPFQRSVRSIIGSQQPTWAYQYEALVCSKLQVDAVRLIWHDYTMYWEMLHAVNVKTKEAYRAFSIVADGWYREWELRHASEVNNPFALKAFEAVRDNRYFEFELKWAAQVHTDRELKAWMVIMNRQRWTEFDLEQAATLDDKK